VTDPATRPVVLVLGARGLLGRAVVKEYAQRGHPVVPAQVRWYDDEAATADLRAAIRDLVARADGAGWRVVWSAGAGVTSSTVAELSRERNRQETLVAELLSLSEDERLKGRVFFASSAGGVYSGSAYPPFTEDTRPVALAHYGRAKLAGEALFTTLHAAGIEVRIGRLANLYGPGQDLAKPQGLISQLSRSHHTAVPVNIYVSLDTLRDYLYVDDAARLVVDLVEHVDDQAEPGAATAVVKILASGRSVSVAALLGEMNRIVKRRIPVVLAASPHSRQQARDLRLRSCVLTELDARPTTSLTVGVAATNADVGARFRSRDVSGLRRLV